MSVAEAIPHDAIGTIPVTRETWESYREMYLSDPWEFARDIVLPEVFILVERFHKPLIYLMAGTTDLLIGVLKGEPRSCEGMGCCEPGPLKSALIDEIYKGLRQRNLSVHNAADLPAITKLFHNVNIRIARKMGKTSCGEVGITWTITVDPDRAWMLVSRDDPAAEAMCTFIRDVILRDVYRAYFPDRVPENTKNNLTKDSILLLGRSKFLPQPCVTAKGVGSGWVSMHFTDGYNDDLVGMENRSPEKLKIVTNFQTNEQGLRVPEVNYTFHKVTTGTRWAREDDSYALENDPNCLTLYVPIEILRDKDGDPMPRTFENMMDAGEPTLPEWYSAEKIATEKQEYMRSPEEGPVALLANMLLTVEDQASALFPPQLVDKAQYHLNHAQRVERPAVTQNGAPIFDEHGVQKKFTLNPFRDLDRKMGVDPAVSETGDEWGITIVGRDRYGVKYQLQTESGRGAESLMAAIRRQDERWNCSQIGIEKAAQQGLLILFLQKDSTYRSIAGKVVPVTHGNRSKDLRNEMYVATPMRTGDLLINPSSSNAPLRREMKNYTRNNRNGKDGMVDSLSIAVSLFDTAASGVSDEEMKSAARADNRHYEENFDKQMGILLEPLFADDREVWGF